MLKKLVLSLSTVLLSAVGVQAQTEFGLKAGLNFPTYSYGDPEAQSDAQSITSYYAAAYVDMRIAPGFYFHPEISLQSKGARIVKHPAAGGGEILQRVNWLDFPFNLLGKVPLGNLGDIFAGAGPYLSFAMNGENTYEDGSTSAVIIYKENLKSIDHGIDFLMGVKLGKRLTLSTNYRLGLANISHGANNWSKNIKNRVFSLGIGVVL